MATEWLHDAESHVNLLCVIVELIDNLTVKHSWNLPWRNSLAGLLILKSSCWSRSLQFGCTKTCSIALILSTGPSRHQIWLMQGGHRPGSTLFSYIWHNNLLNNYNIICLHSLLIRPPVRGVLYMKGGRHTGVSP